MFSFSTRFLLHSLSLHMATHTHTPNRADFISKTGCQDCFKSTILEVRWNENKNKNKSSMLFISPEDNQSKVSEHFGHDEVTFSEKLCIQIEENVCEQRRIGKSNTNVRIKLEMRLA